jgi:hypothetical protein
MKVDKLSHLASYLAHREWCRDHGIEFVPAHAVTGEAYHKEIKAKAAKGITTRKTPSGETLGYYEPYLNKGQQQVVKAIVDVSEYIKDEGILKEFFNGEISIDKFKYSEFTKLMNSRAKTEDVRAHLYAMCSPDALKTRAKVATPTSILAECKGATGALALIENSKTVAEVKTLVENYVDARLGLLALLEDLGSDLNAEREKMLELVKSV